MRQSQRKLRLYWDDSSDRSKIVTNATLPGLLFNLNDTKPIARLRAKPRAAIDVLRLLDTLNDLSTAFGFLFKAVVQMSKEKT